MTQKLLTRDEFRNAVFARDKHTCVFCPNPAQDAHHILERRLWPDSGYYLDNGASVCGDHHMQCEMTTLSVEDVRDACGITKILVPPHLYPDQPYDKWGNPILPNGQRLKGDLFNDESVQKVLEQGKVLRLFTHLVKYPRSYHVPWSENMNEDDRMMGDLKAFAGKEIVVTMKLDGENTSLYRDYFHTRSLDGRSHESQNWVKQFHSTIAHDIPEGWRVCGENLYAKHSIHYNDLPTYFMGFSIWNDQNECLSWKETLEWFSLLGIVPVPVLFRGLFENFSHKDIWSPDMSKEHEGYVLRLAGGFHYREFRNSLGKYVRKNHVQTIQHWRYGQQMVKNNLVSEGAPTCSSK